MRLRFYSHIGRCRWLPGRWCPVPAAVHGRCRYQSGQALFSPLKLRSEGLVPASAAPCADADFHSHLPPRRDSLPSCPRGSQEATKRLSKAHARRRTRLPHNMNPPALRRHPPAAALPPDSPLPSRPTSGCRRCGRGSQAIYYRPSFL